MAFKTFAPGVLTSSDVNTFLMRQAVITCTSSTRPSSPSEGMTIYETDTDLYRTYSGSAWEVGFKSGQWVSYTPTIQNIGAGTDWALGNGSITGYYQRVGRLVHGMVVCEWGSTSTFGSKALAITGPVAALDLGIDAVTCGQTLYRDDSLGGQFYGDLQLFSLAPSWLRLSAFAVGSSYASGSSIVSNIPFTWASDDTVSVQFTYEAASA